MLTSFRASSLFAALAISYSSTILALTDDQRIAAAQWTADNNPACNLQFYWEIGDAGGMIYGASQGAFAPSAGTKMPIYSASKWIYGAYVYEERDGALTPTDAKHLRMLSGHDEEGSCLFSTTVGACASTIDGFKQTSDNKFSYAPGHFQVHASSTLGLSSDTKTALADRVHASLDQGAPFFLTYNAPQLAGSARSSASDYAIFLRKLLDGSLQLGAALGTQAVCTYTGATDLVTGRQNCPAAVYSPMKNALVGTDEAWSYSLGHWTENDPVWLASGGDAAFSSPGFGGFYPWIDATRNYYGILARNVSTPSAFADSAYCGRQIRKAWLTGQQQP